MNSIKVYLPRSPDDLPFDPRGGPVCASEQAAWAAREIFARGYARQGYYKTAGGLRLPLGLIVRFCSVRVERARREEKLALCHQALRPAKEG